MGEGIPPFSSPDGNGPPASRRRSIAGRAAAVVAALLVFAAGGCDNRLQWDYQDDPYLARYAADGDAEALRRLNSRNAADRQLALRILAESAARAAGQGRHDDAQRTVNLILDRYTRENNPAVRRCVITLCMPLCGRAGPAASAFLRQRIAVGDQPGPAAVALATLGGHGVYELIAPLTEHPLPEARAQGAMALAVLGDPRGAAAAKRVVGEMRQPPWPDSVDGLPFHEARRQLAERVTFGFGP